MTRYLTIALVALSSGLSAQGPARVVAPDSGAWVRYVLPPSTAWHTGRVIGREGRTIRVRLNVPGVEEQVSLDSMQRLQLGTRRPSSEGAERGALIGLLIGVSASFVAVLSVRDSECGDGCGFPEPLAVGILGALGTAVLTLGGAAFGAATPVVTWPPEDNPRQSSSRRAPQLRLAIQLPFPGDHR